MIADPGVVSLIQARSQTFLEINHEIIDSRRVVVSYKQKCVHKVLVNRLVKLAQEKLW